MKVQSSTYERRKVYSLLISFLQGDAFSNLVKVEVLI